MIKFYDTCSLLKRVNNLFDNPEEQIVISSITFQELESIKTSNKDYDTKLAARRLLALLSQNREKFTIHIYRTQMSSIIVERGYELTNDTKILSCAIDFAQEHPAARVTFITNDLSLLMIAASYSKWLDTDTVTEQHDEYSGYVEKILDEQELIDFYSNLDFNTFNLLTNQYLIIKNQNDDVVDSYCWTGETHRRITYQNFNSNHFGNVKPIKGDIYQALLADSLATNRITMVKGPAGSGKTFMSLAYLFSLLERGRIDRIIVFCNTVATKDSAKLGFYPGSRDEKLIDSQIGNLLSSKLGGRIEVEKLIDVDSLVLLPLSDVRGYDTNGMRAGVYISEAQNMSISLMKLALQRIGEDSICIIDGDVKTQVDDPSFAGENNGMKRASKVFRNHNIYGEVELKNIHRSEISRIAEDM